MTPATDPHILTLQTATLQLIAHVEQVVAQNQKVAA